jgi:hypothetical protein
LSFSGGRTAFGSCLDASIRVIREPGSNGTNLKYPMKLFTFSGIGARFFDLNDGSGLRDFAKSVIDELPGSIRYDGTPDVDHFVSYVNFNTLLSDLGGIVSLSGSPVLNAEALSLAPKYGAAVLEAIRVAGADADEILVLAHSQGTNNFAFTWRWLLENHPQEMKNRVVRVAMFDPKVGIGHVQQLMAADKSQRLLKFLFFQSELDLLDNQNLARNHKFIDQLGVGDHLWVRALDHGTIVSWRDMNKPQGMLTLPLYREFCIKRHRVMVHADLGLNPVRRQGTNVGLALRGFVRRYPMISANPSAPLLGFLRGNLPARFASKSPA